MNSILAKAGNLGGLDWGIVGVGAALLFVISYVFGCEERDTDDFFLGGRRVPPVVACPSFLATEITFLPGWFLGYDDGDVRNRQTVPEL